MKKIFTLLIIMTVLVWQDFSYADNLDWFLTETGTVKEFDVFLQPGNKVVGKTTEILSEVNTDQFGDVIVKIIFKTSFAQIMSTNGYTIYKLDKGTNRLLKSEMYNEQSGLRQTWDDPYPYVIMSLPLTVGKTWKYEMKVPDLENIERKVIGKEKIKLPAGEFETMIIRDEKMGDMEYYAKGIGLVANKKKLSDKKWYWMMKLTKTSHR